MKSVKIALAATLAFAGCGQRNQKRVETARQPLGSAQEAVQNADSDSNDGQKQLKGEALSRFDDAKIYCLGMLLYAEKNQNLFPTNLDLTLPFLKQAGHAPSGTNRFEILYQGSFLQLSNPATIVLRSEPWQEEGRKWTRIYGFADGHCETHSELDGHFDAWEKRHLSLP